MRAYIIILHKTEEAIDSDEEDQKGNGTIGGVQVRELKRLLKTDG